MRTSTSPCWWSWRNVAADWVGPRAPAPSVREALALDPLREDAWRTLMDVEATAGNGAAALRAYEDCRAVLADELGVDPSPATQALHGDLLRGEVATPARRDRHTITSPTTRPDVVPYVGLRAFRADEAALFFGRDAEVQALVDRLAATGLVAVVGPSGVGKSSLVHAGLRPALAAGAIADSDTWVTCAMVPGSSARKSLAAELGATTELDDALVTACLEGPDGLHRLAEEILAGREPVSRLLVVVDQLEELFTLGDPADAEPFVELLATAARRLDGRVVVVATMRADFYESAASVPALAGWLSRAQFVVPPVGGDQVETIVAGPARRAGVTLEEGLLGRITADVAGEPGVLPLLQHLLHELWKRRTDQVLTRGAYEDLGGVAGALARRADAVFTGLGDEPGQVARRVLLRCVQPGDETGDARRPVRASELGGAGAGQEQVDDVVRTLVDARLLTAGTDVVTGERVVELAHEALIDAWPRLRGWVDDGRAWLLDARRVTAAADAWEAQDRHGDWLLAGRQLDAAHQVLLAEARGDIEAHLAPAERDLVEQSLAARERDRAADAAREAERQALQRRARRRWWSLVAVVGVAALVGAGVGWNARREGRLNEAWVLVAAADESLEDDPQRSLLLALEAAAATDPGSPVGGAVDGSLHAAIAANRTVSFLPDVDDLLAVAPTTGQLLTKRGEEGPDGWAADLRDPESGDVVATMEGHGGDGGVWGARFTPDGGRLLTGDRGGHLFLWELPSGRALADREGPGPLVNPMAISPDGRLAAVTWAQERADAILQVVHVDDLAVEAVIPPRQLENVEVDGGDPQDIEVKPGGADFSPDGTLLAVGFPATVDARPAAQVAVFDTTTWEEVLTADADAEVVAWSPDGTMIAVSGVGGTDVLDAATGASLGPLPDAPEVAAAFLTWSSDGRWLATNQGLVWDLSEEPSAPLELSGAGVGSGAAFAGSSSRLVMADAGDVAVLDLDPAARAEVARFATTGWTPGIDFAPDGTLVADSGDGAVTWWDPESWTAATTIDAHEPGLPAATSEVEYGAVTNVDVSADGARVVTAGFDDAAMWSAATGEPLGRVPTGGTWSTVAAHPDGEHAAVVTYDPPGIAVVDGDGRQVQFVANDDSLFVETIAFDPTGRLLASTRASAAQDGGNTVGRVTIRDWQADTVRQVVDGTFNSLDWSPTGERIALAGFGLGIWDVAGGERVVTMADEDLQVNSVDHSPDGTRLVSCAFSQSGVFAGGPVQVWDTSTGEEVVRLADDSTGFCRVRMSPDGRHVAFSDGGPNASVRIYTMDREELVDIARSRVVRGWTPEECLEYLRVDTCPDQA